MVSHKLIVIFLFCYFLPVSGDWNQYQSSADNTGRSFNTYVNPANADTILKFNTGRVVLAAPIVIGDIVYAATEEGILYAINYKSGGLIWSFSDPTGILSTPAGDEKKIYVATRGGRVVAINRFTGSVEWHFNVEDTVPLFREFQAPVKLTRNRIYVGNFNGRLYCLDTSGTRQWDFKTQFYIKEGVAIRDTFILLSSRDELLYGLIDEGDTCRLVWTTDPSGTPTFGTVALSLSTPAFSDTLAYLNFLESDGYYWTSAFNIATGQLRKKYSDYILNNTGFAVTAEGIVLCNGQYYPANPDISSGKWSAPAPGPSPVPGWCLTRPGEGAPIVIGNGAINVCAFNPSGLYWFDPLTRAAKGGLAMTGYTISSSLAASDSAIFFGTHEGFLFGIGHGKQANTNIDLSVIEDKRDHILAVTPNPFNPSTSICILTDNGGLLDISIHDPEGRLIFSKKNKVAAGKHYVVWNGCNRSGEQLPSGTYLVSARLNHDLVCKRITLLR